MDLIDGDAVDPFAMVDLAALAGDLRLLMRGPGAQPGQDMSRIGPALRLMCGIAATDRVADAVDAAAAWLRTRVTSLGSDERACASLAFGLDEGARFPGARARLAAAAEYLGRSEDTARRHAASAITLLARTAPPRGSIPLQLRRHAGSWIHLGFVADDTYAVVTARCFLMAVSRDLGQPDKVYANVFGARSGDVLAIPAVRVRHVSPAPRADPVGHEW